MALNINGTTGISGVDGSVSAPAVTGTDSNTGITFPAADTIKFSTGGVERMSITNSGVSGVGGKIHQVKSVTKSDTFSLSGTTSFTDVTGLSIAITPTSSSNKILVLYDLSWGTSDGHVSCRMMRDSTAIKVGDAAGSARPRVTGQMHRNNNDEYDVFNTAGTFLDSPNTTSSVTYKWQVGTPYSSSYNIQVNRQGQEDNGDVSYNGRPASSITVMEVAA